jgi:glycosyltransferase involved in cell wall biosynthesis
MDLTVVVPAYNEDESLPELAVWIDKVCTASNITYEMIVIDDGSNDDTWNVLKKLGTQYPIIS